MTTKMKGLLKGLRYISQIFDNEKEPEMMIGYPTDVKHVAHIGWDGPSVTSPSWMNEFKSSPRHSAPLDAIDQDLLKDDSSSYQASEGSSRRGARAQSCHGSPARELPEPPKSTRRHSSHVHSNDSPTKSKSEKVRPPRRKGSSTKEVTDGSKSIQQSEDAIGDALDSPTRRQPPDVPKKSRRKKSKDSGGTTRSSSMSKPKASSQAYESQFSDPGTGEGAMSALKDGDLSESSRGRLFEEEEEEGHGAATSDRHIP